MPNAKAINNEKLNICKLLGKNQPTNEDSCHLSPKKKGKIMS